MEHSKLKSVYGTSELGPYRGVDVLITLRKDIAPDLKCDLERRLVTLTHDLQHLIDDYYLQSAEGRSAAGKLGTPNNA